MIKGIWIPKVNLKEPPPPEPKWQPPDWLQEIWQTPIWQKWQTAPPPFDVSPLWQKAQEKVPYKSPLAPEGQEPQRVPRWAAVAAENIPYLAMGTALEAPKLPLGKAPLSDIAQLGKRIIDRVKAGEAIPEKELIAIGKKSPEAETSLRQVLKGIKPEVPAKVTPVTPEVGIPKVEIPSLPEPTQFAGNIRLEKYPEAVRPYIQSWAEANPAKIETARRGVRSDVQVFQDAQNLVNEVGGNFAKRIKSWKSGQAWNAEDTLALRGTLNNKTQEVIDTLGVIRGGANSTENQLRLQLALQEHAAIQEAVHGVTAEAGRSLRQFRQSITEVLASNDVLKMNRLLESLGKRSDLDEIARALMKIDINDPAAVNAFIRSITKPKVMDYITEIFYNSILSGPKTHIINAMSNTLTGLLSPIERMTAATVEPILRRIQGRPTERFMGEAAADIFGLLRGLPEGLRAALYMLKNGIRPEQITKWEFRQVAFKGKLGATINFPSRALEAADVFGHAINYTAALRAESYRVARMEGLKGQARADRIIELIQNPSRELLEKAHAIAEYRLFRQPAGKVTQRLINLREGELWGIKPLRFVIPFLRTPINLVKFGLERSPLGWLNPNLYKNVITKNPEAADQIGRAAIGSILAAALALYVADDKITGAPPTNPKERELFYLEGKLPYAIKIGDNWVSYQRLEPFNQMVTQVAAVVEAIKNNEKTVPQKALQVVETITKNFVSQTYMSSIGDLINALEDPDRYGGAWLNRFVGSLAVPYSALSRTIAQSIDQRVLKPTNLLEAMKANIPVLSKQVPTRMGPSGLPTIPQTMPWSPVAITTEEGGEQKGKALKGWRDYLKK